MEAILAAARGSDPGGGLLRWRVIPAVVLAAGASSRMGRPKANLPLADGHTFLSAIVSTLLDAGIDDVMVVVGHEA